MSSFIRRAWIAEAPITLQDRTSLPVLESRHNLSGKPIAFLWNLTAGLEDSLIRDRKCDAKHGLETRVEIVIVDSDEPPAFLDHLLGDPQTDSGAAVFLRSKERLKDTVEMFRGNSDSIVGDRDDGGFSFFRDVDFDASVRYRECVAGIGDDVDEDLPEVVDGHAYPEMRFLSEANFAATQIASGMKHGDDALDDLHQAGRSIGRFRPGEVEGALRNVTQSHSS